MELRTLDDAGAGRWDAFLAQRPDGLVYQSWRYGRMLRAVLPEAEPCYLAAVQGDDIVGVLPCFMSAPGPCGPVLNSLPFFGSHGGVLAADDAPEAADFLLRGLDELARARGCASATVITSPFESRLDRYEAFFPDALRDQRISMVTPLPGDAPDVEEALFARFHSIRRNDIRRAQRAGVRVRRADDEATAAFLARAHGLSMTAIGGLPKPDSFYRALFAALRPGQDWSLYAADLDGTTVAALLVLHWGDTLEYFVPAILAEHRNTQAMALAIYTAMVEGTRRGFRRWNWGGTGLTMDGVYHFKSKWGTREGRYHYFTRLYPEGRPLLEMPPARILAAYPWFFTLPFHALAAARAEV
ncbi:MAG: lipid II:glycine glycyltransferase FemX [Desulfovibrionaceae bacterium]